MRIAHLLAPLPNSLSKKYYREATQKWKMEHDLERNVALIVFLYFSYLLQNTMFKDTVINLYEHEKEMKPATKS